MSFVICWEGWWSGTNWFCWKYGDMQFTILCPTFKNILQSKTFTKLILPLKYICPMIHIFTELFSSNERIINFVWVKIWSINIRDKSSFLDYTAIYCQKYITEVSEEPATGSCKTLLMVSLTAVPYPGTLKLSQSLPWKLQISYNES
jgi:hypothetical protein